MRKRRLGHVQLVGGAGEMAVARDRFEVPQPSELHGIAWGIYRDSRLISSHICVASMNLIGTLWLCARI
jgi:hypothetical protein